MARLSGRVLGLFACVAGARGLKVVQDVPDAAVAPAEGAAAQLSVERKNTKVLLLGCSVDRNAVEFFCESRYQKPYDQASLPNKILNLSQILEARWCEDRKNNLNIASLFHPGVGHAGDLKAPFFYRWTPHGLDGVAYSPDTKDILDGGLASTAATHLLKGTPNIVVVDSSLWDLAAWHTLDANGELLMKSNTSNASDVKDELNSKKRVKQWCDHDLPLLLDSVANAFPDSRVAFRTAPTFSGQKQNWPWFSLTSKDVGDLYACVEEKTTEGGLFGKYTVIDYREVVHSLKKRKMRDVFMKDGMHPDALPSLLYINEIIKTAGGTPPYVNENADLAHQFPLQSRKEKKR